MTRLPDTHVTDAYGTVARTLLEPIQDGLSSLARTVTEGFYEFISDQGKTAKIIRRLTPRRFTWLKQRQARHLAMLLSDELSHDVHLRAARKIGLAHTLVGVEFRWIVETYSYYQEEIRSLLRLRIPVPETREAIMSVISQRFLQDMEAQASSHERVSAKIARAFSGIDHVVMSTGNLADLIRGALKIIGALPGGISLFFARVDDSGVLQIEQSYGEAAEKYHRAMEAGTVPKISVDPGVPAGRGPGGRSWRSGGIVTTDTWLQQARLAPWRKVGEALGFRASAAVPILDESGQSIALLSLYSGWPGYFSTENVRGFLDHVQQALSYGVQQRMNAPVVPLREQQAYRRLLAEQSVLMHYQPVIDLRDGRLVKIEGLARLCHRGGELVAPQRFLPALGRDELLRLFEQGMAQICRDLCTLRAQGIETKVAINLPAAGLEDPRYEQAFFEAMGKCDITPDHFQIEVLETQDASERTAVHQAFIQRLQATGVQVAQDDLGSGHSSLLRLDQYPFDEVKIDQGLVRSTLNTPKRAVDFILHLTRLAHAFNTRVTVEGLENWGMIEAAAILGADYGQGYGIAKPMAVDQLPAWHRDFNYTLNPGKPKTAIGALAGYMLWDMQLATISERPELATEFVGARAIVDQFIKTNKLHQSPIEQLLIRTQEVLASNGRQSESAAMIREQLVNELTAYWLKEAQD